MINREWQEATVTTLSGTDVNEWGEPTPTGTTRTISIFKKIYSQTNVSDPRYVDVDEIALTKDTEITTSDVITCGGKDYAVKYVVPSPRFTQVLLALKS